MLSWLLAAVDRWCAFGLSGVDIGHHDKREAFDHRVNFGVGEEGLDDEASVLLLEQRHVRLGIDAGEVGESPARPALAYGVGAFARQPEDGLERAIVDVPLGPHVPAGHGALNVRSSYMAVSARNGNRDWLRNSYMTSLRLLTPGRPCPMRCSRHASSPSDI